MSRLGMNAEPSMEEILASIRKIIAEEPPGSRASPSATRAGPPSPAPAPQRGFMSREAFMRSSASPEPEDEESTFNAAKSEPSPEAKSRVEPPLAATGREPSTSEAFAASKKMNGHDKSPADRKYNISDESEPARSADSDKEGSSKTETKPEPEAKSIEAQLADLLGDDLHALNGAQHGGADSGTKSNIDVDSASVTVESPVTSEPRPGFTVSRIGFTNGSADTRDSSDPFAFDLGPSPFSSHSPEEFSAEHQKSGSSEPTPAPAATAKTSASGPTARPNEPFAVPSVAATLGPHRTLEPLSAAFQSDPFENRRLEHSSFENRSFEHQAQTPAPDGSTQRENSRNSVRAEFRGERLERMLQPAPIEDAIPNRVIEDAVADLLRPLLRTWLAENMPKIVERALRREMTDRLLPGQKGPFD